MRKMAKKMVDSSAFLDLKSSQHWAYLATVVSAETTLGNDVLSRVID